MPTRMLSLALRYIIWPVLRCSPEQRSASFRVSASSLEGFYFAFVVAVSRVLAKRIAILLENRESQHPSTILLNRRFGGNAGSARRDGAL